VLNDTESASNTRKLAFKMHWLHTSLENYFFIVCRNFYLGNASRAILKFSIILPRSAEEKLASHLRTARFVQTTPDPVISSRSNRIRLIHLCLVRLQKYFHFRLAPLPCDAHRRPAGHLNTFVPRDSDINHRANAPGKSERAPASDCKGRVTSLR